jgi:hypothetical protein
MIDLAVSFNDGVGPMKLQKYYAEWTSDEFANELVN